MNDPILTQYLIDRIESIHRDVQELLRFKWQIIGGSLVASVVVSSVVTIVIQLVIK